MVVSRSGTQNRLKMQKKSSFRGNKALKSSISYTSISTH